MQRIEFRGADEVNYMVSVPVAGQEKPIVLRMWVAYDRGSGVGMFCDCYPIIMPRREWLYGWAQ